MILTKHKWIWQSIFAMAAVLNITNLFNFANANEKVKKNQIEIAELQWVICDDPQIIMQKMNITGSQIKQRSISYTDSINIDLFNLGYIIRTRTDRFKSKSVLKTNYTNANNIPWEKYSKYDFKCEFDVYLETQKIGCKLTSSLDEIIAIVEQEQPAVGQMNLKSLGPATSTEWTFQAESKQIFTLEQIKYNQYNSMEISTRVPASDIATEQKRWTDFFNSKKINICSEQKGNTSKLLKQMLNTYLPISL